MPCQSEKVSVYEFCEPGICLASMYRWLGMSLPKKTMSLAPLGSFFQSEWKFIWFFWTYSHFMYIILPSASGHGELSWSTFAEIGRTMFSPA